MDFVVFSQLLIQELMLRLLKHIHHPVLQAIFVAMCSGGDFPGAHKQHFKLAPVGNSAGNKALSVVENDFQC